MSEENMSNKGRNLELKVTPWYRNFGKYTNNNYTEPADKLIFFS